MSKRKIKTTKVELTDGEKSACMDYLHGDVVNDEFQAARDYEYARESKLICDAARLLHKSGKSAEEVIRIIEFENLPGVPSCQWYQWPWLAFWSECPSFPDKSYNRLSERERAELRPFAIFPSNKVHPLPMHRLTMLDAMDVFDDFKAMAVEMRKERSQSPSSPPLSLDYPVMHVRDKSNNDWPFFHALFLLDFSKDRSRLEDEFKAWLQLPENKARFEKYQPKRKIEKGTAKEAKDRLKDLAAWRLYRVLGCDGAVQFANKHRKQDKGGVFRPFLDAREVRSNGQKILRHQADLYSEESGFIDAKSRAEKHLKQLLGGLWTWQKEQEQKALESAH